MSAAPQAEVQIMFSAGEASGDHYAAKIFTALKRQYPSVKAFGLGGQASRDAGIRTLVAAEEIAVMGLFEVLLHYPKLKRAMNTLQAALAERRPALLIAIDYQEFNQRLARYARSLGIPVLFFVAPQVWAWRPKRAAKMRDVADQLAVLFPFEVRLFEQVGVPTVHVGHPLVDMIDHKRSREQARQALGLPTDQTVVGLLPGSRLGEIHRLLPLMLGAARQLHNRHPDWQFILPIAHTLRARDLTPLLKDHRLGKALQLTDGQSHEVMRAANALLVASGTASLEAAIIGTPMVITYRTNWLTYQLARRLINTPYIGLPNIIAQRRVVPELIQHEADVPNLAAHVESLVTDQEQAQMQRKALAAIRQQLGDRGAVENVARLAMKWLPAEPSSGQA